ncbi:MAG: MBL fold metallo-hydrolase [Ruminococcus sp.]|jgi:phosphoribosyl 1,2-cyclic phosphodiesterase|nr:MBL fold metallo-hydrolase [Ruminococcus sp.]
MRLYPLYSSSKGNCYYLGTKQAGVLIDAGGSTRRITNALSAAGISLASVKAVFVTHEHSDHIGALPVLLKRVNVPVFGTPGTVSMLSLPASHYIPENVLGMKVSVIKTSHDSAEPCGFRFDTTESSISFLTDSGVITADFEKAFGSETVVLESNYDPGMLSMSYYPPHTKARIAGRYGHLSNKDSAAFARELIKHGAKNILLAHLSENNNTPDLAKSAFLTGTADFTEGKDCFLKILPPALDNWFCSV